MLLLPCIFLGVRTEKTRLPQEGVEPQLHADTTSNVHLKIQVCFCVLQGSLLGMSSLVGQEPPPNKCVCACEFVELYGTTCEVGLLLMKVFGLLSWMLGHLEHYSQIVGVVGYSGNSGSDGHCWSLMKCVLPLDFDGRLRVIKSMFLAAAYYGIEASFLADASLRKLRTTIF